MEDKKINILIVSDGNYAKDLMDYLFSNSLIQSCYVQYYYFSKMETWESLWKENNKYLDDPRVHYVNQNIEYKFLYDEVCDFSKLPALDKNILESMLPYESMSIKLARRRYSNFPIVEYEEAKMDYHKVVRFWNNVIEEYGINAVVLDALPHLTTTYVIYALAQVKKVPILTLIDSVLVKRKTYTFDCIENHGNDIANYYSELNKKKNISIDMLEDDIRKFYKHYTKPHKSIATDPARTKEKKDLQISERNVYFGGYVGIRSFLKPYRHKIQEIMKSIVVYRNLVWYRSRKRDLERIEKNYWLIKYFKKHQMVTLKEYDDMAGFPDYNKPYIYFALQLTPEGTVMPRTGVFSEQYTSIQLIARAAEKVGVYVYVKEHFVQAFRERAFYEALNSIPNVSLIKSSVDAFDMMHNCIATGTQTGTCLLESPLQNKPVIVTSSGYSWKGMPYVFEIVNEEQGAAIIKKIKEGIHIEQNEMIRYFYAVQNNTVYYHFIRNQEDVGSDEYRKTIDDMKVIVKRFIEERCIV